MARKEYKKILKTKRMFITGSSRTKGTDTFLTSSYEYMSASFASNEYLDDSGIWESQGALIYQLQNMKDDIDDLHAEISSSVYVAQVSEFSSIATGSFGNISSSLIPNTKNKYNLGSSSREWHTSYMLTASIGGGIFTSASLAAGGSGGGGSMNNFTLAGDGGDNQTIADGNTLTIAGGNGITTTGANTDTVSIAVDAAQSTITSIKATDLYIGEDNQTGVNFETENEIHFDVDNSELVNMKAGVVAITGSITASNGISSSGWIQGLTGSFAGNIHIHNNKKIYWNGFDKNDYIGANGGQQFDIRVNGVQSATFRDDGVGIGGYFAGDEALNVDGAISASTDLYLGTNTTYISMSSATSTISASFFKGDGSGLTNVSATATPAGSNTQVQFNSGGSMAGDSGLVFNSATNLLTVGKITSIGSNIFGDSADDYHTFTGNITASNHISSSGGDITADRLYLDRSVNATSGHFTGGMFTAGVVSASVGGFIGRKNGAYVSASNGNIEISGSGRGQLEVDYRLFDTGSINTTVHAFGAGVGDIVKFGGTTTTAGTIYYLKSDGTWDPTDADEGYSSGSLAVALGSNSTTHGMLLRGIVALNHEPGGAVGNPVYLTTTAGRVSTTAPGTGDFARVVGFRVSGSAGIYFNPDNTVIKVS